MTTTVAARTPARSATWIAALSAALCAALLAGACSSTDEGPPQGPTDEVLLRMQAHGTPGFEHEQLMKKVGEWNTTTKQWTLPGTEPMVSEGRSVIESVHNGLFIRERSESDFAGHPFTGEGFIGYDNTAEKFVSIWVDSMGSGMYYAEGECRKDCRVMEFLGSATNPADGGLQHFRYVQTDLGADGFLFEIYMQLDDGRSEWRMMETRYTRL